MDKGKGKLGGQTFGPPKISRVRIEILDLVLPTKNLLTVF